MPELAAKLGRALADTPRSRSRTAEFSAMASTCDLDELRQASRDGKNWISRIAGTRNREHRNQVPEGAFQLGLWLFHRDHQVESRARAPPHYTRKQTTVGGERFITPELKEMEAKILGADERARHLEYQLFQTLREETLRELGADPADGQRDRDARRHLWPGGDGPALPLLPARSSIIRLRLCLKDGAPSSPRSKSGGGKVRA